MLPTGYTHLCQQSEAVQGYIFGGVIAGPLGWRAAFLLEAAAMVPFVIFCALAPPINLKGMETGASLQSAVLPSPLILPSGRSVENARECRAASKSIRIWYCNQLRMSLYFQVYFGSLRVSSPQDGRCMRRYRQEGGYCCDRQKEAGREAQGRCSGASG